MKTKKQIETKLQVCENAVCNSENPDLSVYGPIIMVLRWVLDKPCKNEKMRIDTISKAVDSVPTSGLDFLS